MPNDHHPLDDVRYTPWGQQVEKDLSLVRTQVHELDTMIAMILKDLQEAKTLATSISANTQWLVDMYRGSKALAPILVGMGTLLIAVAAVATWLGWGHK